MQFFHSVDARSSATHAHQQYDSTSYHLMTTGAERWSDQRVFGDRAHFHVNVDAANGELKQKPNNEKKSVVSTYFSSELRIDRVNVKDAIHLYRCRVDFKLAQTRNSKVNLTVVGKLISLKLIYAILTPNCKELYARSSTFILE